jgi:DNA mismatch endonuclease Vsr
MWLSI